MLSTFETKHTFLKESEKGPLVLEPKGNTFDPFLWVKENRTYIETELLQYGAILLRNFNIYSVSEFNRIVQTISPNLLDYVYRSTPRKKLGGKIFTATEYPSDRVIPLHNENSYTKSWPSKIFFFNIIPALEGGETPIADSREVYKRIDPHVISKFEKYGVTYIRNYNKGVDLSWNEVFQTDEKEKVAQYCIDNDIEFEWKMGFLELTTRQTCQGILSHPITKEKTWFNQAHLFHISSLDESTRCALIKTVGEENIPRNSLYGNGELFKMGELEHIREVYNNEKVLFTWQRGDIMILDNILMAHGRETYKGERKIAVAMA